MDERRHVILYDPVTKKRTTVSYPKFLMEQHLGRKLLPNETVDHKDEDYTNDDISNLQVLTRQDNASRSAPKMVIVEGVCQWCSKTFSLTKEQIKMSRRPEKRAGPFCSNQCVGYYAKSVELGGPTISRADVSITYKKDSGFDLSETQKRILGKE